MTAAAEVGVDRPFADAGELAALIAGFEDGTLPRPRWTHRAHLAVGRDYCSRMPAEAALALLRERIRRYNVASGGVNSATAGYHETITRFYVWVVGRFLREEGDASGDPAERANRLFERYGARDLPRRYYSDARLFSVEARACWMEPDLRPLEERPGVRG
jgi:hypothetical protein